MKILIVGGQEVLLDDDDYEKFKSMPWRIFYNKTSKTPYVLYGKCIVIEKNKKYAQKTYMLHREVLSAPKGIQVDHVNGNGLDNRQCNLRFATASQNQANRTKTKINSTGFKGVKKKNKQGKYAARITYKGKEVYLGIYTTAKEAARAYDKAALTFFGEFARINGI